MQNPENEGATLLPVKLFFYMILAEVVYTVRGQPQIYRRQFFEKSDTQVFPAGRLQLIQNSAALQMRSSLPPEDQEHFVAIDVLLMAIHPLGLMTEDEFWNGMNPAIKKVETPHSLEPVNGVTVVDGEGASNVHPISPGATAVAEDNKTDPA